MKKGGRTRVLRPKRQKGGQFPPNDSVHHRETAAVRVCFLRGGQTHVQEGGKRKVTREREVAVYQGVCFFFYEGREGGGGPTFLLWPRRTDHHGADAWEKGSNSGIVFQKGTEKKRKRALQRRQSLPFSKRDVRSSQKKKKKRESLLFLSRGQIKEEKVGQVLTSYIFALISENKNRGKGIRRSSQLGGGRRHGRLRHFYYEPEAEKGKCVNLVNYPSFEGGGKKRERSPGRELISLIPCGGD